jgi:hypothetical protein
MKINQIIYETTTAGAVATVSKPLGEVQKRPEIKGIKPVGQLSKKKNGPYANSLNEGAMKQLSSDLKGGPDGLSDQEFQKKYKMSKQAARQELASNRKQSKPEPVQEARLEEDDIIQMPGRGSKRKTGFVPRGQSRVDHEVEMARSDVLATMKNAKAIYQLLQNRGEDEGLEGWVQEKLIKANDYLNAVKEYYDEKMMEQGAGVIAGGGVGEGRATYGPVTDAHKASSKKVFAAGVKDGKAGAEKNKQHMASALMKTTYLNGYKQGEKSVAEGPDQIDELSKETMGSYIKKASKDIEGKKQSQSFGRRMAMQFSGPRGEEARQQKKIDKRHSGISTAVDKLTKEQGVAEGSKEKTQGIALSKAYKKDFDDKKPGHTKPETALTGAYSKTGKPGGPLVKNEGAKVDRMVKHIEKSEKNLGKSKDEAENIAWATANKRGMLDNKNKKAK